MKRSLAFQTLLLLLALILTACVSPPDNPIPAEPVEYHVTEVKKTWGDDKFAPGKEIDLNDENREVITDRSLITFDKEEVCRAVADFVIANFDPEYTVTEVEGRDDVFYLAYYDGRLCCVIAEFFVHFMNTGKDGTTFEDHIHCGAIVFLE